MSPEEQQIAIAKACGWKGPEHREVKKHVSTWTKPEIWFMNPNGVLKWKHDIPDYLNDLNAMHEAEKTLIDEVYEGFLSELGVSWNDSGGAGWRKQYSATAAQRAEAFLKTLELWKENDEL